MREKKDTKKREWIENKNRCDETEWFVRTREEVQEE